MLGDLLNNNILVWILIGVLVFIAISNMRKESFDISEYDVSKYPVHKSCCGYSNQWQIGDAGSGDDAMLMDDANIPADSITTNIFARGNIAHNSGCVCADENLLNFYAQRGDLSKCGDMQLQMPAQQQQVVQQVVPQQVVASQQQVVPQQVVQQQVVPQQQQQIVVPQIN